MQGVSFPPSPGGQNSGAVDTCRRRSRSVALLYLSAVCATRRRNVERGGRPFLLGRRSGLIEAGGSLIRGTPGRVGSSPDNAGTYWHCQTVRVRLARPVGVTRVNQWLKPRNECPAQIWWIGAGGAVRDSRGWGVNSEAV